MKKLLKFLLILAVLCALGVLPFHATDVAELLPVRTVIVTRSGKELTVDVGAGVKAVGNTLSDALRTLRQEVTGELFFQTAEQVVLAEDARDALPQAVNEPSFRPAAAIYVTPETDAEPDELADYLHTHGVERTLTQTRAELLSGREPELPILRRSHGGWRVVR